MKPFYDNISKIRNILITLQNFRKKIENVKKIEKIHIDSKKITNLFQAKKG